MAVTYGLIEKGGAWYSFLDNNAEVITDSEDNLLKFQGKAKAMEYLKNHEDFYKELREKLEKKLCED